LRWLHLYTIKSNQSVQQLKFNKMKTSNNKFAPTGKFAIVLFAAMAVLNLFVSAQACAQSKKEKARLSKVTFMDEYVRKANEKAIMENLGTFVAPVVEKKVNSMKALPDGSYLFLRAMENPAVGDNICLTKTDADGNIVWERTYIGDGFSSEPDNFMKRTRDGGYLIQRTICSSTESAPALTQQSASK
jgi:hypothetical protein